MSRNVVLVSHGKLAEGVQSAVEMVFGKCDELSSLGLTPDGNVVELIAGLRARVEAAPQTQFVILADIFGGSVCNQCLQQLSEFENVKLVSGLSMGLALSVLSVPGAQRCAARTGRRGCARGDQDRRAYSCRYAGRLRRRRLFLTDFKRPVLGHR